MIFWFVVVFSCFKFGVSQYEVPDALVEVFRPRGLRVSIPDEEGIKLFAFHGQVNKEMAGREGGTFSKDILKAKNGRWTFYDAYAQLKVGDALYYWTYVDYFNGKNKLGYTNDDNKFVVRELLDKETGTVYRPSPAKPIEDVHVREPERNEDCKSSATIYNGQRACAGQLIFHDNFTKFENNLWVREVKFGGSPDHEFVIYSKRRENLEVKNGQLKIRPMPSEDLFGESFVTFDGELDLGVNCTGIMGTLDCVQKPDAFLILPPVASAQITTKNKWSFKYGKIEIRAKLPKGDWIYPELFLNPLNDPYGPEYLSGQIRVAFVPGNKDSNKYLQGGCILGSSRPARNYGMKTISHTSDGWSDDFHTFTVVWKPDQITVSVDTTVYGNIFAPAGGFISESRNLNLEDVERWRSGTAFAPFDKEMYLVLGVGVGGHCFEDRSDGTKPWQNSEAKGQKKFYNALSQWKSTWSEDSALKVDYVKVWAL